MHMMKHTLFACLIGLACVSCNHDEQRSDAYGNFEAEDVLVSAEGQGKLFSFPVSEGDRLKAGDEVAVLDTIQIHLKKEQVLASMAAVRSKYGTIDAQAASYRVQLENLERELKRVEKLLADGAATRKQRDDLTGNIALVNAQLAALRSQKATISAELRTMEVQLDQVADQLMKSRTINPVTGTVLEKYKQAGEIVGPGQALYKVANTDQLILRAYISGRQLSSVKTGDEVVVRFDGPDGIRETTGSVSWISPEAEFTPKIIQTREERVNLVYAMKVLVNNDGSLKIGMPGEVKFKQMQ